MESGLGTEGGSGRDDGVEGIGGRASTSERTDRAGAPPNGPPVVATVGPSRSSAPISSVQGSPSSRLGMTVVGPDSGARDGGVTESFRGVVGAVDGVGTEVGPSVGSAGAMGCGLFDGRGAGGGSDAGRGGGGSSDAGRGGGGGSDAGRGGGAESFAFGVGGFGREVFGTLGALDALGSGGVLLALAAFEWRAGFGAAAGFGTVAGAADTGGLATAMTAGASGARATLFALDRAGDFAPGTASRSASCIARADGQRRGFSSASALSTTAMSARGRPL